MRFNSPFRVIIKINIINLKILKFNFIYRDDKINGKINGDNE